MPLSFDFIGRFSAFLLPFYPLSYPTDKPSKTDSFHNSDYYSTGPLDACLIVTCIAVMAILRDVVRLTVMEPFAQWKLSKDLANLRAQRADQHKNENVHGLNGHAVHVNGRIPKSPRSEERRMHRSVLRFAEQGWSAIYYALQWSYGLVRAIFFSSTIPRVLRMPQYVHRNLPTQMFRPTELWLNYPHTPLAGTLKFYYLTQASFYIHQVLILNAEARRKDHIQMMTHHVITIGLIAFSYLSNFTRAGCLIMVLMDWCDIFLPVSSLLVLFFCPTPSSYIVGQDVPLSRAIHLMRHDIHLVSLLLVNHASHSVQHSHLVRLL